MISIITATLNADIVAANVQDGKHVVRSGPVAGPGCAATAR